jgi:surface protein
MFYECQKLQNLDLSSFNTQNVTDMSHMFYYCYNLKNLNLLSFNTQKVEYMDNMFYNCFYLQSLDLSSFNTQNVTSNGYMFEGAGLNRVVVNVQDNLLISKAKSYSIKILYA